MSIPLVPNPIPPFSGPSGGDVVGGFLSAFFGMQNNARANDANRRADQQQGMQVDEFNYQKTLRPLREQGMQLDLQGKRQSMQFGAEDQSRQNETYDYQKEVLRPLQEASARNGLLTQAYGIEETRQKLDASSSMMSAQMEASRAIEQSMAGLAGFGQSLKSAPTEIPTRGKVTSYGYADDPYADTNSANRIGAYDNTLDESSLAVSPDVERQMKAQGIKMGDAVHLRLADGTSVTRKLHDRTMQDEDATAKFGKPLTGRFDFFSPGGKHGRDGQPVVSFSKASSLPAVRGMEAGPVQPEHVTQALNQYDTLVRNMQLLPPNSPARVRGEVAIMQAQADPTFSGLLKMREINTKNRELGNGAAAVIMATPAPAQEMFKQQFPQFADLNISRAPDGTYDVVRNAGGRVEPLDLNQKIAFTQAYEGFIKAYKPPMPGSIPTGTLNNYAKAVQVMHSADDLDPSDNSDIAQKVRAQAAGARYSVAAFEAINPTLKAYASARETKVPMAPDNTVGLPSAQPKLKTLPSPEDESAAASKATKEEKLNKAVDVVAPRLQVFAPDNGKDDIKLNPALTLARKIHQGLTHEGKSESMFEKFSAAIANSHPSGRPFTAEEDKARKPAIEHALEANDLQPDGEAADGVTNSEAAKAWAVRILAKYGYETAKGKAAAPAQSEDSAKKAAALKAEIDKF